MIRDAIASHPFAVLCYAAKHGYAELMDKAEEAATGMSLEDAYEGLTRDMYIAWVRSRIIYLYGSILMVSLHALDSVPWVFAGGARFRPPPEKSSC